MRDVSEFKFRYSRAFCNVRSEIGELRRVYHTVETIRKIYKIESYESFMSRFERLRNLWKKLRF